MDSDGAELVEFIDDLTAKLEEDQQTYILILSSPSIKSIIAS